MALQIPTLDTLLGTFNTGQVLTTTNPTDGDTLNVIGIHWSHHVEPFDLVSVTDDGPGLDWVVNGYWKHESTIHWVGIISAYGELPSGTDITLAFSGGAPTFGVQGGGSSWNGFAADYTVEDVDGGGAFQQSWRVPALSLDEEIALGIGMAWAYFFDATGQTHAPQEDCDELFDFPHDSDKMRIASVYTITDFASVDFLGGEWSTVPVETRGGALFIPAPEEGSDPPAPPKGSRSLRRFGR